MSEKKQLKRVIVAGDGNIAFGMGFESILKLPLITISALEEPQEIGTDVVDVENEEILTILFKNVESLAVLEKMCGEARKYFESQTEVKPE